MLNKLKDVLAYSHEGMLGVDPRVVVHYLNIKSGTVLIKQKMRRMNDETTKASNAKVDELVKARFMKDVRYPK